MSKEDAWIQTYSGKKFHIFDPKPEEVDIEDIAHALSLLCRFNGQCNMFYSVAEHSMYVANEVENEGSVELTVAALFHDASEAYIGDMTKPLKRYMDSYKEVENNIQRVIEKKFYLTENIFDNKIIKDADMAVLLAEKRDLMSEEPEPWDINVTPISTKIVPVLDSKRIKDMFILTFRSVTM